MQCKNCKSNINAGENLQGLTVCSNCGYVMEDSGMVWELGFEDTKIIGTVFNHDNGEAAYGKHLIYDPSRFRLLKAYEIIQDLGSILCIEKHIIEKAKRYYNLANTKKFLQGRKTRTICSVILYTICRLEQTNHLLIDFSDATKTNLFILGSLYLKFIKHMNLSIPLVDPSLFIHRYCSKFNFTSKSRDVTNTALRIVQCMKNDWIAVGRRPSGIIGAAIIISARFHGFKLSMHDVTREVKTSEDTIRKRLAEFSNTKIAKMKKSEFEEVDLEDLKNINYQMDPPSFLQNQLKEKEITSLDGISIKAIDGEKESWPNDPTFSQTRMSENISIHPYDENFDDTKFFFSFKSCQHNIDEDNEVLSDLNEEEYSSFILSQKEYLLKKALWEIMNKDWIEEQEHKKKLMEKGAKINLASGDSDVQRIKNKKSTSQNPYEAIISSSKLGKHINHSYLKNLFKH